MKNQFFLFLFILFFLDFTVTSCLDPESEYRDRLSIVNNVSLPDSVCAGNEFTVSFVTFGANACWKKGHDEIIRIKNGFRVVPYDLEYTGPNMCAQAIADFEHQVSLPAINEGKIIIEVLHRLKNSSGSDSTGVITKELVVF